MPIFAYFTAGYAQNGLSMSCAEKTELPPNGRAFQFMGFWNAQ